MASSILDLYQRRVASSRLARDQAQVAVARRLDRLSAELAGYRPQPPQPRWRRLIGGPARPAPRGLYIWGGVGRGKTMLMELFYDQVPVARKRRVHFHDFMQDVHGRIHDIRQQQRSGRVWDDADPIALVCTAMAETAHVLCFDEFQVTDITDAMILGRLFEALLAQGVVVVATSNTPPGELYRDGLNRDAFLPFIAMLESSLDTVHLESPRDHRLDRIAGESLYVTPLGHDADCRIDQLWRELTDGADGQPRSLYVAGREIAAPRTAGGVARFSFAELCQRPFGPGDYIAVAKAFHTVIVERVPKLAKERHNEARRFANLIDTLYDRRIRLAVSAATAPEEIHAEPRAGTAFARTVSRLHEMCSKPYWQAAQMGREPAPSRLAALTHSG